MTQRQIARLIYLRGDKRQGYAVETNAYDDCPMLRVPSVRVGNAIVRALREVATARPDLFRMSRGARGIVVKRGFHGDFHLYDARSQKVLGFPPMATESEAIALLRTL